MNNNVNILAFHEVATDQDFNKWWTYAKVSTINVELNQIPPFQKVVTGALTELKLVSVTGQELNILDKVTDLTEEIHEGYNLVIYPATTLMTTTFTAGQFYVKMLAGGIYYYSDYIRMCSDVSSLIKLEYWHDENFVYPNGVFNYENGYKHYTYLHGDISKPQYLYDEKVSNRNGHNFTLSQNVYKVYRFTVLLPEYTCDALRLSVLHDNIRLSCNGSMLNVKEFNMSVEWLEQGHLAVVEFTAIGSGTIANIFSLNTINPTVIEDDNNVILTDDAGNVIGIFQ